MSKLGKLWPWIIEAGSAVDAIKALMELSLCAGAFAVMVWSLLGSAREWLFIAIAFLVVGTNVIWAICSLVKTIVGGIQRKPNEPIEEKPRSPQKIQGNNATCADREFFVGQWKVGCNALPTADTFMATLRHDGSALRGSPSKKNLPDVSGKWELLHGEARISWSDGWVDILRCVPGGVMKLAYSKPPFDPNRGLDNTATATRT